MSTAENSSLFHPLTRRPQATTVTVRELIQKVQAGEVRIPRFQRPLRWNAKNVRELFDSIWRGYPVGSLLFWKRPADADVVRVGSAEIEARAVSDAWWVVDGQQRITALAAALLDLPQGGDGRWSARFDPEHEEFLSGDAPPERRGLEVPLSVLGDLRRLGRWIREEGALDERLIDRIEDAQQRILDYAIPAYIVETEEERALRAVFARMNSTGARMRADEVFQALLGAPSSEGESLDLDALQRDCDIDGFGVPPRGDILKAVLAMSGIDPTRRLEELRGTMLEDLIARSAASDALSRTVAFLVRDCGIPHVSLIPYPVVFFILARWFHVYPDTPPETRRILARWVWRGAVSGTHQRAEVSRMREQVKAVRPDDPHGSLDRLLASVNKRPRGEWELGRFNLKSAKSRVEALALLALEPRDQYGRVLLEGLMTGSGRVAREVFASTDWRGLSPEDDALAKSAANRVLLDAQHTGLHAELRHWDPERDREALRSHLIDDVAFELLVQRDVAGFLRHRAVAVAGAVDRFTTPLAAWDEMDLKPVSAYLEPVDE